MTALDNNNQSNQLQLVSFKIGAEEFGINILEVQEIIRMVEITSVPQTPDYVEGVINLRGKVIPVVDLRKRLSMETQQRDHNTRIVVVDVDNEIMGLIVDSVSEVLRIPAGSIEPAPEIITGMDAEYIKGVVKLEEKLLMSLDLSKIVDPRQIADVVG